MTEESLVCIRPARPTDTAYIRSSWLKGWREHLRHLRQKRMELPEQAQWLPHSVYWSDFGHSGLVDKLLWESITLVACPPTDEDVIAGWCCFDETTMHYEHVAGAYKAPEFGVAKELRERAGAVSRTSHPLPGQALRPVNPYLEYGRSRR